MSKESKEKTQNGKINFNVIVLSYQNANVCHHHVIWLALFSHCIVVISSSNVCIAQNILLIIIHAYIISLESMIKRPTATDSASENCALAWLLFSIVNIEFIVRLQWKCSKHYDVNHGKKKWQRHFVNSTPAHNRKRKERKRKRTVYAMVFSVRVMTRHTHNHNLLYGTAFQRFSRRKFNKKESSNQPRIPSNMIRLLRGKLHSLLSFCLFAVGIREPFHCPYGCWRFNSI